MGMSVRAHKGKESVAPKLAGSYFKFMLEKLPDGFDVLAPGPAANSSKLPYVLMHMMKRGGQTRVVVPEPATAVDDVFTPTDAPSTGTLGATSETTPERPESPDEVTGLIERLSLLGTTTNSDGGAAALARALALKTEGNQHFSSGDYPSALLLYSEAIEMLEGAGEDVALATILCNRSVAYLKARTPVSALTDAERARALGGGKAHFRRAEALFDLGRSAEALEAYKDALVNAVRRW